MYKDVYRYITVIRVTLRLNVLGMPYYFIGAYTS